MFIVYIIHSLVSLTALFIFPYFLSVNFFIPVFSFVTYLFLPRTISMIVVSSSARTLFFSFFFFLLPFVFNGSYLRSWIKHSLKIVGVYAGIIFLLLLLTQLPSLKQIIQFRFEEIAVIFILFLFGEFFAVRSLTTSIGSHGPITSFMNTFLFIKDVIFYVLLYGFIFISFDIVLLHWLTIIGVVGGVIAFGVFVILFLQLVKHKELFIALAMGLLYVFMMILFPQLDVFYPLLFLLLGLLFNHCCSDSVKNELYKYYQSFIVLPFAAILFIVVFTNQFYLFWKFKFWSVLIVIIAGRLLWFYVSQYVTGWFFRLGRYFQQYSGAGFITASFSPFLFCYLALGGESDFVTIIAPYYLMIVVVSEVVAPVVFKRVLRLSGEVDKAGKRVRG
ncbi:hypothetical protein ACFL56_02020 [Candidatus Margulisiibacteriota bacterium]